MTINSDLQIITRLSMNENIISPFTVAYLYGYNGTNSPIISPFSVGNSTELGLQFVKNDTRWDMIVTKTQDYENMDPKVYIFEMEVETVTQLFEFKIENIFDNSPTVSYENPCKVEVRLSIVKRDL